MIILSAKLSGQKDSDSFLDKRSLSPLYARSFADKFIKKTRSKKFYSGGDVKSLRTDKKNAMKKGKGQRERERAKGKGPKKPPKGLSVGGADAERRQGGQEHRAKKAADAERGQGNEHLGATW